MALTDVLIGIHQRETGAPLSPDMIDELRELAETYNVDTHPGWLLPIFEAVEQGREVSPPIFFEREDSDPYSYLVEVAGLLGWKAEFEGEYEQIDLPVLGWRIYICNEARSPTTGRGGSTYQITRLSA